MDAEIICCRSLSSGDSISESRREFKAEGMGDGVWAVRSLDAVKVMTARHVDMMTDFFAG